MRSKEGDMTSDADVRDLSHLDAAELGQEDIPAGAGRRAVKKAKGPVLTTLDEFYEEMNSKYTEASEGGLAVTLC